MSDTRLNAGRAYWPGLDGVRAVAVLGVLAFHQGFGWARGGFLGVSLFFTLSGFLITRRLVAGVVAGAPIDLRQFWIRRARRLLPAAWVVAAGSVVASARLGIGGPIEPEMPVAVLTQLLNWHLLSDGHSYGDVFAAPTVLDHYWSLAIEEQFYLVVPLGLWLLLGRGRTLDPRSCRLAVALGLSLAVAGASAALLIGSGSVDLAYYGTHTRLSELAIGVAGGIAVVQWPRLVRLASRPTASVIAIVALGAVLASWGHATVDDLWLYDRAGLSVHAIGALVVVVVAAADGGFGRLLATWPLRRLGRVSYSLYLVHWPIFLALDPARTGLDGWPLFALRLALSIAAAQLVMVVVENPFRTWSWLRRPAVSLTWVTAGATAVLVAATAVPPTTPVGSGIDLAAAQERFSEPPDRRRAEAAVPAVPAPITARSEASAALAPHQGALEMAVAWRAGRPQPPTTRRPPPAIGVFGDSSALMTAIGLELHAERSGLPPVSGAPLIGCGLIRSGWVDLLRSEPVNEQCATRIATWTAEVEQNPIDVAVVLYGPWEVADYQLPGESVTRSIGDPVFDDHLLAEMHDAVDFFSARGIPVVWLLAPDVDLGRISDPRSRPNAAASGPGRMGRWNALVAELATARPAEVRLIDLPALLDWSFAGGVMDPDARPDGVHLSDRAAVVLAEALHPAIVATVPA